MATNGGATTHQERVERGLSALTALMSRVEAAQRLGYAYSGNRDVYTALGWPKQLTWDDLVGRYERQDIAGAVVDKPVDACWRAGFELTDDEAPDTETPFEAAWRELDQRVRARALMQRLDRVAGIGEYGALFIGVRGQDPLSPLRRARPEDLLHLSVFTQPCADVEQLDRDPSSARFGLPETYGLSVVERTTMGAGGRSIISGGATTSGETVRAHWSRVIHAAEGLGETKVYGRPRLQRVFNALFALELVVGAAAEGFWRSGARARYHANISPDFSASVDSTDLSALGDQVAAFVHGMQDWLRTTGTDVQQFASTTGDPRGPVEVLVDLIAAASGVPKRILLGSERGELASSQDAVEWNGRVAERQRNHLEPVVVRPLVDRLIFAGILPEPRNGEYEVRWPDLTGPTMEARAELADRIAAAEMKHAQAEMLGKPLVTRNELREALGYEPVEEIEDTLADDDPQREEPEPEDDDEEQPSDEDEGEGEGDEDEEPAAQLAVQYDPDQPRDPAGTPTGGQPKTQSYLVVDYELGRAPASAKLSAVLAALGGEPRVNAAGVSFADVMRAVGAVKDDVLREATVDRVAASAVDMMRRTADMHGVEPQITGAIGALRGDYAERTVRMIGDTTRARLLEELVEGWHSDEDARQIARRARKVFRDSAGARATNIALSETTKAMGVGAQEGLVQSGVLSRTWNSQRDDRVRFEHADMDGQTVPMGEPFTAPGGETAMHPGGFGVAGLDLGCRCYLTSTDNRALNASEVARRQDVHVRRVRAGVRRALREQRAAVLAELER